MDLYQTGISPKDAPADTKFLLDSGAGRLLREEHQAFLVWCVGGEFSSYCAVGTWETGRSLGLEELRTEGWS